jgi:FKBP-type peptidyl-prolyl cis-trans isomerase FklB
VQAFQKDLQAKLMAEMEVLAAKNKADGEAFLAENAKQEGVVVTSSGLQYKVLEPGEGDAPTPADTVTVNYRGTLVDGTQFDSSYDRGQPATFPVQGVIPGWTEALQLMKPGSKYQLAIPAELAYGERGAGQTIGPNSTLLFDVELISVEKAKK